MKSKYLFIDEPGELTAKSKIFNVWVGKSAKDRKAIQFLQQYSQENGLYLAIWSNEVSRFLLNVAKSFGTKVHLLDTQNIQITDLVQSIKKSGQSPSIQPPSSTCIYLRMQTSPNYFFEFQTEVLQSAKSVTRKKPKPSSLRIKV